VKFETKIAGLDLKNYKQDEVFYDKKTGMFKFNAVCNLGGGALFGEVGILNARPRTATIIGRTNVVMGELLSKDYKEILQEVDRKKLEKRLSIIRYS